MKRRKRMSMSIEEKIELGNNRYLVLKLSDREGVTRCVVYKLSNGNMIILDIIEVADINIESEIDIRYGLLIRFRKALKM